MSPRSYMDTEQAEVSYRRILIGTDLAVRIRVIGITTHELRDMLTGFWASLPAADRADMIKELTEYQMNPDSFLPITSSIIAQMHEIQGEREVTGDLTMEEIARERVYGRDLRS